MASLTGGKLRYALADLAALPRAAVVVEDRYSRIFNVERVRPAVVADGLAEPQARWPNVPIVYAETPTSGATGSDEEAGTTDAKRDLHGGVYGFV